MKPNIEPLVNRQMEALAYVVRNSMRYEALRRLTPKQFAALHTAAMLGKSGDFDTMVDALVLDMHTDKQRSPGQ